jgi:hypothetical protein
VVARRAVVAAGVFVAMMAPALASAASCDDKVGEITHMTGTYVTVAQNYAKAFVFALRVDCQGRPALITVQRSTGYLPVYAADQTVEVVGKLLWNRALVDGHYEINNPSKVICVPVARTQTEAAQAPDVSGPAPLPSPTRSEPPARRRERWRRACGSDGTRTVEARGA